MKQHTYALLKMLGIFALFFPATLKAVELKGGMHAGFWYLKNNVDQSENYLSQDGYGNSYVQGQYTLLNLRLKMDVLDLTESESQKKTNLHFKTRALINPFEHQYSLAVPDRYRFQVDTAAIEFENLARNFDLWLGRQIIEEMGGIGVDGLKALVELQSDLHLGIYGGLGNDLRNLTGYIGPNYRLNPVSLDFLAGGMYVSFRSSKLQADLGINSLFYENKLDRVNLFASSMYRLSGQVNLSGLLDLGVAGDQGLSRAHMYVTYYPTSSITLKSGYIRYRSLYFSQSDQSGIPVPSNINSSFTFPNETDTSAYNIFRQEVRYRIERDSVFGSIEYAKRSFDDAQRFRYSVGYHHPKLFQDFVDLRTQVDIIDNYRGFNTSYSLTLGKDFMDDQLRVETRGIFYANERDGFVNGSFDQSKDQIEKEATGQITFLYMPQAKLHWSLSYAFHREVDVENDAQNVNLHDIYISSNIRF